MFDSQPEEFPPTPPAHQTASGHQAEPKHASAQDAQIAAHGQVAVAVQQQHAILLLLGKVCVCVYIYIYNSKSIVCVYIYITI